jgi:hypothetical protein
MSCPAGSEWTIGGITCKVVVDGYKKGNSSLGGGPWRDIIYQCPWDDSDAVMDALLDVASYAGGPGGAIAYPSPYRYPGNTNLVALECNAELVGYKPDVTKVVSGDLANIFVHFGVPPFDIDGTQNDLAFNGKPVPWGRDTVRGFYETHPIEKAALEDAANNNPPVKGELKVPILEFHRSRLMVPYLNLQVLTSLIGKVNDRPIGIYDTGTIRVEPWDVGSDVQPDGTRVVTLEQTFSWRPKDWNYQLSSDGVWTYYDIAATGAPPHPYDNIGPLLA